MPEVRSARLRAVTMEFLYVAALLAPLVVCFWSGLSRASLWLDEIIYYYCESDVALRAAELGRPGSALAPHLSIFSYCDVQQLLHSAFGLLGWTVYREPELYLRFSSIVSYAVAVIVLYAFLRRRLPLRGDALLGAAAFATTPIFLHYAFEARVYAMATMLVVLTVVAVDRAAERPSRPRLLLAALLGLVTVHSHIWTVCLFAALLLVAAFRLQRARRLTPWAASALAAAIPALVLAGVQVLYLRITDPGAPLFPPFQRQEPGLTLIQLLLSNFLGVIQTQYIVRAVRSGFLLAYVGGAVLLAVAWLSARGPEESEDGRKGTDWTNVAVGALFFCWLLAVGYGYYTQARYHVPLMGSFFFAVTRFPSKVKRLLLSLLVACNVGLFPATVDVIGLKGNGRPMAEFILKGGSRDVSVVCQHVVSGDYPLPLQTIGLDFYLNFLRPGERPIFLYQMPDLSVVNGRRGVYDLFAGGLPVLEQYLRSTPELWRKERARLGDHVFVVQELWNIEEGIRQRENFARVMLERGDWEVAGKCYFPGFTRALLVELRKKAGT